MGGTIRVTADPAWSDPAIDGLDVDGTEWRLDVGRYEEFLRAAAGIDPAGGLSVSDCYRIGNRLQAIIEAHKRDGEWDSRLVEDYPAVNSLEEFLWVARFFETCRDCKNAGEVCFSPGSADDVRLSPG